MKTKSEEVLIYTAEWCAYCKSLRQKLDSLGLKYKMKDVDNPGMREEMNSRTNNNQTIPVLFIKDNYWVNPSFDVLAEQFKVKS